MHWEGLSNSKVYHKCFDSRESEFPPTTQKCQLNCRIYYKSRFRCPVPEFTESWIHGLVMSRLDRETPSRKGQHSSLSYELIALPLVFIPHAWTLPRLSKHCPLNNGSYRSTCLSQPHIVSTLPAGATARAPLNHAGSVSSWGLLVRFRELLPSAFIT